MKKASKWIFPALLVLIGFLLALYTFNKHADLNGDNFNYYIYATSLAEGQGYCDLSKPSLAPTNNFPPGYPIIMAPLRMVTDSIVAQKVLNEILLILGILLAYLTLLRLGLRRSFAFALAGAGLFCPRVFHFSTMMMSESAFFMTSMLVMYALAASPQFSTKECGNSSASMGERFVTPLRNKWFWVMILTLVLNYHIRTQGLALVAGVFCFLLLTRRWYSLVASAVVFVIGCLPWMIRNNIQGLNGNRYVDAMMTVNPWRPEEGTLTLGDFVSRFFETLKMLVFQAIPNSIPPFLKVEYNDDLTVGCICFGGGLLILICIGFWRMEKLRWFLLAYFVATLGLISLFSTPSENRYLTTILPLLTTGAFLGLAWTLERLLKLASPKVRVHPIFLWVFLFTAINGFNEEHEISTQRVPPAYESFFKMAVSMKEAVRRHQVPENVVVCSRKPNMFYLYSNVRGLTYKFTQDDKELISHLVENKVDYVLFDNLGYSSTELYLYPAIKKHMDLFPHAVFRDQKTGNMLLYFDRSLAKEQGF